MEKFRLFLTSFVSGINSEIGHDIVHVPVAIEIPSGNPIPNPLQFRQPRFFGEVNELPFLVQKDAKWAIFVGDDKIHPAISIKISPQSRSRPLTLLQYPSLLF